MEPLSLHEQYFHYGKTMFKVFLKIYIQYALANLHFFPTKTYEVMLKMSSEDTKQIYAHGILSNVQLFFKDWVFFL